MAIRFIGETETLHHKTIVKSWLIEVCENYNYEIQELNYNFVSQSVITEYNNRFLNHNWETDIITFDQSSSAGIIAADILVSPSTILSNSILYKSSYKVELLRVLVHGVLHLMGFDDHNEADITKMRSAEENALSLYPS